MHANDWSLATIPAFFRAYLMILFFFSSCVIRRFRECAAKNNQINETRWAFEFSKNIVALLFCWNI